MAGLCANAAEIRLLGTNPLKGAVIDTVAQFERETGHRVVSSWAGSEAITKRVGDGEVVDVVLNPTRALTC